MICPNCSGVIPEGSEVCPFCKSKIEPDVKRCPNCWARLEDGESRCKKCGCNIQKMVDEIEKNAQEEPPTLWDSLKRIPLWIRILVPLVVMCLVAGLCFYSSFKKNAQNIKAAELSEEYIESANEAIEEISKMAKVYEDMVYKQSWLDHTGSAAAVRDVYKEEINDIKKTKEPLNYAKNLIAKQQNDKITELANDVYFNYNRCFGYVIGENGTYPNYMKKYQKIVSDYEKSVEKLKEEIEKYN